MQQNTAETMQAALSAAEQARASALRVEERDIGSRNARECRRLKTTFESFDDGRLRPYWNGTDPQREYIDYAYASDDDERFSRHTRLSRYRQLQSEGYDGTLEQIDRPPTTVPVTTPVATPAAVVPPPSPPADASNASPDNKKRKRRDDGPGLGQSDLVTLGDIDGLWTEYAGPDGTSGLRRRDREQPNWRAGNRPSRQLYIDKRFIYREIAGQADAFGSVDAAKAAVQARLDAHKTGRSAGWSKLIKELQKEQPDGSERKANLERLLSAM
eukprot:2748308-Prymnesium_polylepis.1